MEKISGLEQKIRHYVNEADLYDKYFYNKLNEWQKLCVAMDILGDTCCALLHYEQFGIGDEIGEQYIKLYGLFQSFILQQDSIKQIYEIFLKKQFKLNEIEEFNNIRDIRNMMAGHPNSEKHGIRTYLSRITISNRGFQLVYWNDNTQSDGYRDVELLEIYKAHKIKSIEILQRIVEYQIMKYGELPISD